MSFLVALILYVVALILNSQVVWNNIHFVMWDLGGQESLRTAWNTYYSNTELIILVIERSKYKLLILMILTKSLSQR